jgi:hypothetical protein
VCYINRNFDNLDKGIEDKQIKIDETQFYDLNVNNNIYETEIDGYVKKKISNCWGILISDFINQGNQFFSITINPIYDSFNFKSSEERGGFEYDLISHLVKYFPTISFM